MVDGLDECEKDKRHELVKLLGGLIEQSNCNCKVKIFISSRNDRDLKEKYIDGTHLEVEAHDNGYDIRKYVEEQLKKAEESDLHESLSPDLRREILDKFDAKSDGM